MNRFDLHMHTTHSDGQKTPRELFDLAKRKGLEIVAVTDHDTVDGFAECEGEAQRVGIRAIPGIELSAEYQPGTMHVLGYFLDAQAPSFAKPLAEVQQARRERNPMIIEKLRALGIDITLAEVVAASGGGQVGRPHFASVLIEKGYAKDNEAAFERYLKKGAPAYVDKRRLTPADCIDMIHGAGGVAVVAHPVQLRAGDGAATRKVIRELADAGLDGIEVYHSSHGKSEVDLYKLLAGEHGLLATGGSDYHGPHHQHRDLGMLALGHELSKSVISEMEARAAAHRNGAA